MENVEAVVVLDTPEQIQMYRLLALRAALKLECMGLRGRLNAYATIRREFGFRGNREQVYTQFCEYVEKEKGRCGS